MNLDFSSPKLIMTCGPSGAGKSTWAKEFMAQHPDWIISEKDVVRQSLWMLIRGDEPFAWNTWDWGFEKEVARRQMLTLTNAVNNRISVLIPDSNLFKDRRHKMIEKFQQAGYDTEVKYFDVDVETCIQRDAQRGLLSFGEKFICEQYQFYLDNKG